MDKVNKGIHTKNEWVPQNILFYSFFFRYIEGIFTGPDIREIRAHDEMFSNVLNPIELRAWISFKDVCDNFQGKTRSEDYNDKIDELI